MVRVDPSRHYGGPALSEESVVPITADKDVVDHIPKISCEISLDVVELYLSEGMLQMKCETILLR